MDLPNYVAAPIAILLFVGFVYLAKSGKVNYPPLSTIGA